MYNGSATYSIAKTNDSPALTSSTITARSLNVSIVPNPSVSYAKVFVNGAKNKIIVTISDMNGKTLWSSSSTQVGVIAIPTERLSRGTYIVTVQSGFENVNAKLVVAR